MPFPARDAHVVQEYDLEGPFLPSWCDGFSMSDPRRRAFFPSLSSEVLSYCGVRWVEVLRGSAAQAEDGRDLSTDTACGALRRGHHIPNLEKVIGLVHENLSNGIDHSRQRNRGAVHDLPQTLGQEHADVTVHE